MSLFKYFGEQNGGGRGNLYWNRAEHDGMPFRGNTPPMMREEEYEQNVAPVYDVYVDILDLSNDEDKEKYRGIQDRAAAGLHRIMYVDRQYDPETKNWRVLLEWAFICMEANPARAQGQGPPNPKD